MKVNRLRDSSVYIVVLVLSLLLSLLGILYFEGGKQQTAENFQSFSMQVGDLLVGGLQSAWLNDDLDTVDQMILDIGEMPNVRGAHIIDCHFQVLSASDGVDQANKAGLQDVHASGCIECHQYPGDNRPRAVHLEEKDILRISTPITSPEAHKVCESDDIANMGVLLIDAPFSGSVKNSPLNLAGSIISLVLMGLSIFLIVNYLVIRRMIVFYQPLTKFAAGDLTSRVAINTGMPHELRMLAGDLNQSLEQLEHRLQDDVQKNTIYQRIVFEEREQIARDLHDGLAQILTFINTKSAALRMMIKNNNVAPALKQLSFLEEEAQSLLVDVRMTIWGLRVADHLDSNLSVSLQDFTSRFSQLSQIQVDLIVAPEAEDYLCDADICLQLFRIVQEALTNIRKHAEAASAWVSLQSKGSDLYLIIGDNGKGFDIGSVEGGDWHHFGLSTMQERAKSIGAEFRIISERGIGTQVTVKVPVKES